MDEIERLKKESAYWKSQCKIMDETVTRLIEVIDNMTSHFRSQADLLTKLTGTLK